jgi:hypothetical protein
MLVPAHATLTVYRDKALFLAATAAPATSIEVLDFAGSPPSGVNLQGYDGQYAFSDHIAFYTCSGYGGPCNVGARWVDDALAPAFGGNHFQGIDGYFAEKISQVFLPVNAFAMEVIGDTAQVSIGAFNAIGETYYESVPLNGETGFFGVISDHRFNGFGLSQRTDAGPFGDFRLDTFYAVGAIPEPSTAAGMLAGLAALGMWVWRRSKGGRSDVA